MIWSLSLSLLILHSNLFTHGNAQCISHGGSCAEDCDCCGWPNDKAVRCELRNPKRGLRCEISRDIGQICTHKGQCKSQYCKDGICSYKSHAFVPPELCTAALDVEPISGSSPNGANLCPCSDPARANKEDALKAIDGDTSTDYVNNAAINSGLTVLTTASPLYHFTICSSSDDSTYDPTCYKLEGYCQRMQETKVIQEGSLSFRGRNECITIELVDRSFYSFYSLTFPCQKGGFPECSNSVRALAVAATASCPCPSGFHPFEPTPATKGVCNGATPITTTARRLTNVEQSKQSSSPFSHLFNFFSNVVPTRERKTLSVRALNATNSTSSEGIASVPSTSTRAVLTFHGSTKVGDITEIVYMVQNVEDFSSAYNYVMLQWGGDCCFECYEVYMDSPTKGVQGTLDDADEKCTDTCSSDGQLEGLLLKEDDSALCMQGLKLFNNEILPSQKNYFFKVKVHGVLSMEKKPYGMMLGVWDASILYGDIESPVCSSCDSGKSKSGVSSHDGKSGISSHDGKSGISSFDGQCTNYPMKISEISFSTRCKDVVPSLRKAID